MVVGGDAGGMGAASQARRRDPSLEIVALERGSWTSYSACGIPYLVSGAVEGGVEALVARAPQTFRDELRSAGFYAEWNGKYGDEAWAVLERAAGGKLS